MPRPYFTNKNIDATMRYWNSFLLLGAEECKDPAYFGQLMREAFKNVNHCYPENYKKA